MNTERSLSTTLSIFIKSKDSYDVFTSHISKILDINLEKKVDDGLVIFEYIGLGLHIIIEVENSYDDDLNIPFKSFQYIINIDNFIRIKEYNIWESYQYYFTLYLQNILFEKFKYRSIVVQEFQKIISEL